MKQLALQDFTYTTPVEARSSGARFLPSFRFYCRFINIVLQASLRARRGVYSDADWCNSSHDVLALVENAGAALSVTGIEHIAALDEPCVFIGNHMSIMETLLLPGIIRPMREVTFVVKESLLTYPVFKHVMRSRNPVAVTRTNPRQDLKTVLAEGTERLKAGISIIVFPQTTRSHAFDPQQMSTIGVKLAKKANVPVIPLALKTDAWRNGNLLKDFGKIDPSLPVHFAFGAPLHVNGRGTEEHQAVVDFIAGKLADWQGGVQ